MKHTSHATSRKLTEKEVSEILSSEASFAEYMASLTVEQIDALISASAKDPAMTTLLQGVRAERKNAEQKIHWKLAPAVTGLATVIALNEQIAALEKIQKDIA